jgi:hypothetical protein
LCRGKRREEMKKKKKNCRRIGKYNQFSAFTSHKMVNGSVVAIDEMLWFYKQNQPVTN